MVLISIREVFIIIAVIFVLIVFLPWLAKKRKEM